MPLGRSNSPTFALRWFTSNLLHGGTHTRNSRNPKLTPGGSTGGGAAALTSGIGHIAIGTDIGGSVRYPEYACGVHGLRPSLGRVPFYNAALPEPTIEQLFFARRLFYSAVAEWRLSREKAEARQQYYSPYWLAVWAAKAGHKEETLRLLEAAYLEHSPRLVFLQCEPFFDFLHSEPRYQAIVQKIGFPTIH